MTDSMITQIANYLSMAPVYERYPGIKNRQSPTMTLLSDRQLPGVQYYVELGWIYGIPDPNPPIKEQTFENDVVMLFISGNHQTPEDLGAEIEFELAGRKYSTDKATAVFIPKGVRFGNIFWKSVAKPHIQMSLTLGTRLSGQLDLDRLVVNKPVYEIWPENPATGRMESSMTFLNNDLVPGCNVYIEYSWIYRMPSPNPHIFEHVHERNDEIVLHIGADPDFPNELGAEIEIGLQEESLKIDKTCSLFVPRGYVHGPLTWKSVQRPHIEMGIVLGSGTLAESDPGGHQKAGG